MGRESTIVTMFTERRRTTTVRVGGIAVGSEAPIVVQSMTNTDTADVAATVAQVADLARAGSELVRVTVNSAEAAAAVPAIREKLDAGADKALVDKTIQGLGQAN